MNNNEHNLAAKELSVLFGTTEHEVLTYCDDVLKDVDLKYSLFEGRERDNLLLQVIRSIETGDLAKAGENRQPDWEQGWKENLREFIESGYNLERLVPKYFKKNVPVRLNLDYVMPELPNFVFVYTHIYRTWLFRKYFQNVKNIYEFGCGPAYHLAYLAQMYPHKRFFGLDWASSSQEIIRCLASNFGWKIEGYKFDFFSPDNDFCLFRNSGVLTFGALEQIGEKHRPFLEFLLRNNPAVCVNVECLEELYDPTDLLSYLALQYHKKRNYLSGYLTALLDLEKEGRIEIIQYHHHCFGNLFDDPLSYVIWKPR